MKCMESRSQSQPSTTATFLLLAVIFLLPLTHSPAPLIKSSLLYLLPLLRYIYVLICHYFPFLSENQDQENVINFNNSLLLLLCSRASLHFPLFHSLLSGFFITSFKNSFFPSSQPLWWCRWLQLHHQLWLCWTCCDKWSFRGLWNRASCWREGCGGLEYT